MTPAQYATALVALIGLLVAVVAYLLKSMLDKNSKEMESLKHDRDKVLTEIAVIQERQRVGEEDRRGLREWKHMVVDPYVPRAIEDHERRVLRVEKYLNGKLKD